MLSLIIARSMDIIAGMNLGAAIMQAGAGKYGYAAFNAAVAAMCWYMAT